MSGISTVFDAIGHRPTSRIPRGELVVDREFACNYLAWQEKTAERKKLGDCELLRLVCSALQLDLVCIQSQKPATGVPMLGVDAGEVKLLADFGLFVFWIVSGPFQTLMYKEGMMTILKKISVSPEEVGIGMRQYAESITLTMRQGVDAGAHGIILADDIAYSRSTYMSPVFVEQHLLPEWRRQVSAAGELDVPLFFHSDGNITGALPHIAAAGFHGLQCLEPASGMDMGVVKQQYGSELCLMGNIDPALLVQRDDPAYQIVAREKLRKAVARLSDSMGATGFIFGTCSGLDAGMSPQLVHDMYALVP